MSLTVPEVARRLGRSPETVRRWIRAGKLPASKVGTQHVVEERDLAALDIRASATVREAHVPYGVPAMNIEADPLLARIVIDPRILVGKPRIRGTRISVALVLKLLADGWSHDEILASYPDLAPDDILACLAYAAQRIASERIHPLPAP